ncbi:hypothetical protein SAMN05216266_112224 [Amycolatopsis marina]|uniref:Uncharacterized protein n=1 Tax=Amycolatopsis marina TaxID=490629 RepID=A0A1I1BD74_9PSEU|nr:hypothetical protein [Amycolatopsis marina]SFB46698.1 hypothetical protein SAMN05216266_112224 [Amycolatopsis marina]
MSSGRGSGRRDFSKFNEKLEKHVERLPDYAQRAQEKLQRYLPPADSGADDRSGQPSTGPDHPAQRQRPGLPSLPALSSLPGEIPVVAEARATWARWNDPAAKHQRRIRRTSRALTLWIMLTLLCALALVAGVTGIIGAGVASTPVLAGGAGVVVFGTFGVRAGMRLRTLKRVELPASMAAPPPLPPTTSAARQPMERLRESEASLEELLTQLAMPVAGASSAVPEVSVEQARETAGEAAAALRGLAARLQAVERGRDHAPAAERTALDAAVRTLREQLDDGLTGYGELVAAASRAVAASSGGAGSARESLTDATDHLAGLAIALRELS